MYKNDEKISHWKEFELFCIDVLERSIDPKKWRIKYQHSRKYSDGLNKSVDFHIAERRQGGNSIVVDCKHFITAAINRNEINTTLDYKRRCRASKAIMLISSVSKISDNILSYAEKNDVTVTKVDLPSKYKIISIIQKKFSKLSGVCDL